MADKLIQLQSANGTDNLFPKHQYVLLWTNSSTTRQGAGSVALDLSKYSTVVLRCIRYDNETSNTCWAFCEVGESIMVATFDGRRTFTITTSQVSWDGGTQNYFVIPYKIYGVM